MVSKFAKAVGFIGGIVAIVWAMRDRFISVAVSREPEPPAFKSPARSQPTVAEGPGDLESIDGIGPTYAARLSAAGYSTPSGLVSAGVERVAEVAGVSTSRAQGWLDQAKK